MAQPGVHIKFVCEDDVCDDEMWPVEEQQHAGRPQRTGTAERPLPLHEPTDTAQLRCSSSIRTDYDTQDGCYVLHLAHSPGAGLVAATLSNQLIKLYAPKDAGLQFAGDLKGHTGPITDAHFALAEEPCLLHTSSADGSVCGWDVRTGQPVERYAAPTMAEVLCCHPNGALVAAGAGDKVLFWDRRTRRLAAAFGDTHAQEVTQVRFHPAQRHAVVSASDDGLLAVFDTSAALDEDEGFQAALNIGTGTARLGFYGAGGGRLWCCTTTETLHLWEWAAACSEAEQGGNGILGEATDARERLAAAAGGAGPPAGALAAGVDYLVGCEYNAAEDRLYVAAGNSGGTAGIFPVAEPPCGAAPAAPAARLSFGAPVAVLAGGHVEVVRSVLWPGAARALCLSGGEDARVCVWSAQGGATAAEGGSSGSDGAVRRDVHAHAHARRASPY